MQAEGAFESENQLDLSNEVMMHDVSLSSIKTQDSIENNSMLINFDEEERKESYHEIVYLRNLHERPAPLPPFLTFSEAQRTILDNMSNTRNKLTIRPLGEVLYKLNKISENFRCLKKQEI